MTACSQGRQKSVLRLCYGVRPSFIEEGLTTFMVRLLMKWDIKAGREQPYFEFVMREFAPGLMQLGIEPAEVWYTIYGNGPQMLTIGEADNLEKLQSTLQSEAWRDLRARLLLYVTNYNQRIVDQNNRTFQL